MSVSRFARQDNRPGILCQKRIVNLPAAHQPFVLYRDLLDHQLIEVEIAALQ